jgi:hypothetical protein
MADHKFDIVTRIELDALLSFLKASVPYQSRVARIMRTITEALYFGEYRNSTEGKLTNLTVSKKVFYLLAACAPAEFPKRTVLEHPLPLKRMYLDLMEQANSMNIELATRSLSRYPLVTVTKQEDRDLKPTGWASPAERYANAKIEIGRVNAIIFGTTPQWTPTSLSET